MSGFASIGDTVALVLYVVLPAAATLAFGLEWLIRIGFGRRP